VDVFGSVKTGLFLPYSDLDIVVFGRWKSRPLFTLSDMLVSDGLCTRDDMQVIEKATVCSVHVFRPLFCRDVKQLVYFESCVIL